MCAPRRPFLLLRYLLGTAGWTLPKEHAHHFAAEGTHLQRYSGSLRCVEINSSFHRAHMRKTWERWAATTPDDFRFSVKVPKTVTHIEKLVNTGGLLQKFLDEVRGLNAGPVEKLGPLLVQLPPKLAFDEGVAHEFFTTLRELHDGAVVCEPRHESWFAAPVDRLLREFEVARVAADPPKGSPLAGKPGGWARLRYYRLHGAPRTYYSEYTKKTLMELSQILRKDERRPADESWVIFDNTALGHAADNALQLQKLVAQASGSAKSSPLKTRH